MSLAIKHNRTMCFALTALALCFAATASAQNYPAKPVRYIVPFPAAASPDMIARLLTERLSRLWNQQVVVDNRSGAGGTLGAAFAAKSPADGYTLFQCNLASSAIAEGLYARLPTTTSAISRPSPVSVAPRWYWSCIRRSRRAR